MDNLAPNNNETHDRMQVAVRGALKLESGILKSHELG